MKKQELFEAARRLLLEADPGQILAETPEAVDEYDFAIYEVMPQLLNLAASQARIQKTLGQALGDIYYVTIDAPEGLYASLTTHLLAERDALLAKDPTLPRHDPNWTYGEEE